MEHFLAVMDNDIFNLKDTPFNQERSTDRSDESFEERFESDRTRWRDLVISMAKRINSINNISELQVDLYSNRQLCLEHNHFLMGILAKMQKEHRRKMAKKWEDYTVNYDRKVRVGEANILIEGSLSSELERIQIVENQIQYFQDTIKNIDNIIYGIRYRLNVEDYKRA